VAGLMKMNCRLCCQMDIFAHRGTGMWKRCFANGLGTHANSEIVLRLARGAIRLRSFASIGRSFDTAGSQDTPIVQSGP
jgi:hypothetical protein